MSHIHTWKLIEPIFRRYRCTCGAIGCRKGGKIAAFACQHEMPGRRHCAKDAVVVTCDRQANRCSEHVAADRRSA